MASYRVMKGDKLLSGADYQYDANGNRTVAFVNQFSDDFSAAPAAPDWLTCGSYWSQATDTDNSVYKGDNVTSSAVSAVHQSPSQQNLSFSARVKITATNATNATVGISVRSDGDTGATGANQYYFGLYPNDPQSVHWKLWEFTGSPYSTNVLASDAAAMPISTNEYYLLKVTVEALGDTACRIKVYIDGELKGSYDDTTPKTGTSAGFRVRNATVYFDDVRVDGLTAHTYDAANQLIKTTRPDNTTITYAFDQSGNRTTITDSRGATYSGSFAYDQASRLSQATIGGTSNSYAYDADGNTIAEGLSYRTYNAQDRLASADTIDSSGAVFYTYDVLGRISSRSRNTTLLGDDFTGGIDTTKWTLSNAYYWSNPTDAGNKLLHAGAVGSQCSAWQQITSTQDYTLSAKLKLDAAGTGDASAGILIRSSNTPGPAEQYEYYLGLYPNEDEWKIWKAANGSWGDLSGTQGAPVAEGSLKISYGQYYVLGARAETSTSTFKFYVNGEDKFDLFDPNPLTGGSIGFLAVNTNADFDDVKVEGLAQSGTTTYVYDDKTGALLHELDSNGNITATYVNDDKGRAVSVTRALGTPDQKTFFYHYNAHGDVTAITDSTGNIVATFTYDDWGVPTEYNAAGIPQLSIGKWTEGTGGTAGNGLFLLFGGMLYDAATGLYLTKTRAYNPRTGRFLQRDILDESGKDGVYRGFPFGKDAIGSNLYAWCKNNPVTMVDPSGMDGFIDTLKSAVSGIVSTICDAGSEIINWGLDRLRDMRNRINEKRAAARKAIIKATATIGRNLRSVVNTAVRGFIINVRVNTRVASVIKQIVYPSDKNPIVENLKPSSPGYRDEEISVTPGVPGTTVSAGIVQSDDGEKRYLVIGGGVGLSPQAAYSDLHSPDMLTPGEFNNIGAGAGIGFSRNIGHDYNNHLINPGSESGFMTPQVFFTRSIIVPVNLPEWLVNPIFGD